MLLNFLLTNIHYLTNFYYAKYLFSVLTFGTIITSLTTVASVTMENLLCNKHKYNINETVENWDNQKCTFLGFLAVLVFVLAPKIGILSWMISTLHFGNFGFLLILVGHVALSINFYIDKKSQPRNRSENKLKGFKLLRLSIVNTFHDVLGVRNSVTCNAVSLFYACVFIIIMIFCIMPNTSNHSTQIFDPISNDVMIISNPQFPERNCICKEIYLNGSTTYYPYINENYVCMDYSGIDRSQTNHTSNRIEVSDKPQVSKCYDPIFFEKTFYSFLPSLNDFPTASTCFTFDALKQLQEKYEKIQVDNNRTFQFKSFDQQCQNLTIEERFVPCSEENVRLIAIYSSCLVILICFGVFILIFSTQVSELLLKNESIFDELVTDVGTMCNRLFVRNAKMIASLWIMVISASLFGWSCAKLNKL